MSWTQDRCLQLIDEYEKVPELWNPEHQFYYHKIKKYDAWSKVAENLNCSMDEAKKKMDSLLSSFRREKAKGKKSIGTGKARREVYITKWYAFPRMQFLIDRDEPRNTFNSIEGTIIHREEAGSSSTNINFHDEEEVDNPSSVIENIQEQEPILSAVRENTTKSNTIRQKAQKRPASDVDIKIDETLDVLKTAVSKQKNESDCCTIFGQHIAHKLRSYDLKTRNKVEFYINTILYNADMGSSDLEIKKTYNSSPVAGVSSFTNSPASNLISNKRHHSQIQVSASPIDLSSYEYQHHPHFLTEHPE